MLCYIALHYMEVSQLPDLYLMTHISGIKSYVQGQHTQAKGSTI